MCAFASGSESPRPVNKPTAMEDCQRRYPMKLIDRVTTKMNNTTATNPKFVLDSTDSSTTIVNVRVSVLFEASNTVTTTVFVPAVSNNKSTFDPM